MSVESYQYSISSRTIHTYTYTYTHTYIKTTNEDMSAITSTSHMVSGVMLFKLHRNPQKCTVAIRLHLNLAKAASIFFRFSSSLLQIIIMPNEQISICLDWPADNIKNKITRPSFAQGFNCSDRYQDLLQDWPR